MLKTIKQFFDERIAGAVADTGREESEHAYQLATAALLIEMTRADDEVTPDELRAVTSAIHRAFGLSREETEALVRLAEEEIREAVSLYDFIRLINERFSAAEKEHVIELLWEVAFADGDLDKYEEHLARKIADLIHVPHRSFIRTKHRVKERHGLA